MDGLWDDGKELWNCEGEVLRCSGQVKISYINKGITSLKNALFAIVHLESVDCQKTI